MRVQLFSDIHSDHKALERIAAVEADLYIGAGDLVNWQKGLDKCGAILEHLGDKLWVMPGNHETAKQITQFCAKFGFNDFHEKTFEAGGKHFAGLGYSNTTPFDTPGEYTDEELTEKLSKFASLDPMVLVCHCPPAGTDLDEAKPGSHFGSQAVREFIERSQPVRFFCGHIHEAWGRQTAIGSTIGVNLGKKGYLLEL